MINSAVGVASLALLDPFSTNKDLTNFKFLNSFSNSKFYVAEFFKGLDGNGFSFEGTMYWGLAFDAVVTYMEGLTTSVGFVCNELNTPTLRTQLHQTAYALLNHSSLTPKSSSNDYQYLQTFYFADSGRVSALPILESIANRFSDTALKGVIQVIDEEQVYGGSKPAVRNGKNEGLFHFLRAEQKNRPPTNFADTVSKLLPSRSMFYKSERAELAVFSIFMDGHI